MKDLKEQNTIAEHPLGDVTLQSVGIAVKDIESVTEAWSKYLELEVGRSYVDESLNAKAQVLQLEGGNIVFYEPLGDDKVQEVIDTRGEKPFLLELKNSKDEKDIEVFGAIYRFTK